jgi:ubiquinone/menaquinone biosynthesis C-methylase UbiE
MGNHNETIRREFARQASRFGEAGLTLSSQEYLAWMVNSLPLQPDFHVLDVAAGTGHLCRALAPYVGQVTAIDTTPEMLAEAKRAAKEAGLNNITFEEGLAENLPYAKDSFDLVTSRLAFHHFDNPAPPMAEMVRVCKPGRLVAAIDLLSPDDKALIEEYNRLERLRDPSHATALTKEQLIGFMEESGLTICHVDSRDIEVDVARWLSMAGASDDACREVREALTAEMHGEGKTGMRPLQRENKLLFVQTWAIVVGEKPTQNP